MPTDAGDYICSVWIGMIPLPSYPISLDLMFGSKCRVLGTGNFVDNDILNFSDELVGNADECSQFSP